MIIKNLKRIVGPYKNKVVWTLFGTLDLNFNIKFFFTQQISLYSGLICIKNLCTSGPNLYMT